MAIPFLDLRLQYLALKDEIDSVVQEAMENASFIGGPNVSAFEEEFATFCKTKYCAGVGSGTDALRLALLAMGIEPGDEVITVPNSFIATTEAITQAGGRIVFVDVDPETMLMDASKLEAAITSRTRFIIPVHLTGLCADMDAILRIAKHYGLQVLEDACQAHGASYNGKIAGSMGTAGCFSFYPGKNLGACGEGGAVVSNDAEMIARVKILRDHGQSEKYIHVSEGYNGRLDAIQAAILRVKLRNLAKWNEARRQNAALYCEMLRDLPIELPVSDHGHEAVFHLFIIRSEQRKAIQEALKSHGIGWGLHYPIPLHLQAAYTGMGLRRGSFPVAEGLAERILSLPMYPELGEEQIGEVAAVVRGALIAHVPLAGVLADHGPVAVL